MSQRVFRGERSIGVAFRMGGRTRTSIRSGSRKLKRIGTSVFSVRYPCPPPPIGLRRSNVRSPSPPTPHPPRRTLRQYISASIPTSVNMLGHSAAFGGPKSRLMTAEPKGGTLVRSPSRRAIILTFTVQTAPIATRHSGRIQTAKCRATQYSSRAIKQQVCWRRLLLSQTG